MKKLHDVLLLGASFSYSITKGACPLTSSFLDGVDMAKYPALAKFVVTLPASMQKNLAAVVEELDTCAEVPLGTSKACLLPAGLNLAVVRRELSRLCIDRVGNIHQNANNWPFCTLFNAAADGTTIITTNYDSIAERVVCQIQNVRHGPGGDCRHCKMRTILDASCPCDPTGRVPPEYWRGSLLKLHGSVTWKTCRGACCATGCIVADACCRPYSDEPCDRCCGATEPVVVLPRLRGKYEAYPRLEAMWDAARQALADAKTLGVFGFSFSEIDRELCWTFRKAFESGRLKHIAILDVDPDSVIEKLRPLLPDGHCPPISVLKLPADCSMPDFDKPRRIVSAAAVGSR